VISISQELDVSRESEDDPDIEEAWRAEIERRVAELDSGAVETVPWEIVKARLLQRIRNLRSLGQE